ncbi:hypothetical protein EDB85DRAFT_2282292 [Lactarius pseudohatsudake]|nr:hypothetical protein EDB85DRAFT_2282292 [Lactarius pseudohatsudake]
MIVPKDEIGRWPVSEPVPELMSRRRHRSVDYDRTQYAYLKDNYDLTLEQITALYNFGKFQYVRELFGRRGLIPLPLSRTLHRHGPEHLRALGQARLGVRARTSSRESGTLRSKNSTRSARRSMRVRAPLSGAAAQSQGHAEPLATLHSRAWLVHLSLFVHFNHPAGRTLLLETFLAPAYLNTIQSAAPWVLRYFAVFAVLSRRAQASGRTRELARAACDPRGRKGRVPFLKELYVEFDFEAAQHQLQLAERVVGNDFFPSEFREEFLDNARYLISETYCRIHQRIDIADLSARLNLSPDEGEKWIVNLIRDTRLAADAKIDLEKNVIEIHRLALPISQSVIEKTRRLSIRTQAGAALSRTGQQQAQPAQEQPAVVEGAR